MRPQLGRRVLVMLALAAVVTTACAAPAAQETQALPAPTPAPAPSQTASSSSPAPSTSSPTSYASSPGDAAATRSSGTGATATPTSSPDQAPQQAAALPSDPDITIRPIPDAQWARMVQTGTWRPGCPVDREDLVRMEMRHYTFNGGISRGVLVVHRDVADSLAGIFTRLFEAQFPIRHMRPVEFYDGDSNASLADDNTSAFNCRRPDQINAPVLESPHANGRAIDINPWENPWKDLRCRCWFPTEQTKARVPGPGVIVKGGLVWQEFVRAGWIWQDIDVPDYMHFDTGYPSRPYRSPAATLQAAPANPPTG